MSNPATRNIEAYYNNTYGLAYVFENSDSTPFNIASNFDTASLKIFTKDREASPLVELTLGNGLTISDTNRLLGEITPAQNVTLFGSPIKYYQLTVTYNGDTETILKGIYVVNRAQSGSANDTALTLTVSLAPLEVSVSVADNAFLALQAKNETQEIVSQVSPSRAGISYATKVDMDNDTTQINGTTGIVANDTAANNGFYRWDGTSWIKRDNFYSSVLNPIDESEAVNGKAVSDYAKIRSINLFDKLAIQENKVISFGVKKSPAEIFYSVTNIANLTGWSCSDYIPVEVGKTYIIKGITLSNNQAGAWFDGDFNVVGETFIASDDTEAIKAVTTNMVTAPINAVYFVFNIDRPSVKLNRDNLRFVEYSQEVNTGEFNKLKSKEPLTTEEISVENSDSIVIYGNSFTASVYTLRWKSFVHKVSELIDLPIHNFAISANSNIDILERMRLGLNPYHPRIGLREIAPKYCILACIGNETLEKDDSENQAAFYKLIESQVLCAKSMGMIPIIGTDHTSGRTAIMTLAALARDYDIDFIAIGARANINPVIYTDFWNGSHPGTRTNTLATLGWYEYLRNIKPTKSVKIFRLREDSDAKELREVAYDNNLERVQNWTEILGGETFMDNGAANYDKATSEYVGATDYGNEYGILMAGASVNVGEKALFDFILPKTECDKIDLSLLSNVDADVYIKQSRGDLDESYNITEFRQNACYEVTKAVYDSFNEVAGTGGFTDTNFNGVDLVYQGKFKSFNLKDESGYYLFFTGPSAPAGFGTGEITKGIDTYAYLRCSLRLSQPPYKFFEGLNFPTSQWKIVESNYENGILSASIYGAKQYIDFDKVSVMLVSESAISVGLPTIKTTGGVDKPDLNRKVSTIPIQGERLFPVSDFSEGNYPDWSTTGSLEAIEETYRDYPTYPSNLSHIQLEWDSDDFPETLSRVITIGNKETWTKLAIKVVSRVFPKVRTGSNGTWTTSEFEVTSESYDHATLSCSLRAFSTFNASFQRKIISLGWAEVIFEVDVPPLINTLTLSLFREETDFNNSNSNWALQIHSVDVQEVK